MRDDPEKSGEDKRADAIAVAMSAASSTLTGATVPPGAMRSDDNDKKPGRSGVASDVRRIIQEVSKEARKSKVPLYIAVLAAFLALVSMAEGDVKERALGAQISASNQYAYFQAKNIRMTESEVAGDILESLGKNELAAIWREKAARYDKEKDEILIDARAHDAVRAQGLKQSGYFAVAIALLQIAIVLATAALILGGGFLLGASVLLASAAIFFTLNGYCLVVEFPTDPIEFGRWVLTNAGEWRRASGAI